MAEKKLLLDVCAIRFILIFLLVLYHAFAIFCGAWTPIDGYPEIRSYWWIGKVSYSFMLESFVFISGYVLGYQVLRSPEKIKFKSVATSKVKRLLIPSIVFSIIYYLCFYDLREPVYKICYSILCGTGHLWFLPMLFWCFIFTSLAEKTGIRKRYVLLIAIIMSLLSSVPLPLRLSSALYYFIFFYSGYLLKSTEFNVEKVISSRNLVLSVLMYIVLFLGYTLYSERGGETLHILNNYMIDKGISSICNNMFRLTAGGSGVAAVYIVVNYFLSKKRTLSKFIIDFSSYCFGVYIFQQFILKYLYYYTELPHIISPGILPWFGFIVALFVSLILTSLLQKTNIGRKLLG